MIKFLDKLKITSTRQRTDEGYLRATTALTCVGVQMYSERQLGGTTDKMVGVFRPPETVFHPLTIETAKMKPVTDNHPDDMVDLENINQISVGSLGDTVEPIDAKRLGAPIMITNRDMIKKIDDGTVETSLGYGALIVEKSGVYEGVNYDYAFDGPMMINHLAVVDKGRCGSNVKIFDRKGHKMDPELLKKLQDAGVLDKDGNPVVASTQTIDTAAIVKDTVAALVHVLPGMIKSLLPVADTKKIDDEANEGDKITAEDQAKLVTDQANTRAKLIVDAAPFCGDTDLTTMENRAIMLKAIGDSVKDADKLSDGELSGVLLVMRKDRKAAADDAKNVNDNAGATNLDTPINFMQARKMLRKG